MSTEKTSETFVKNLAETSDPANFTTILLAYNTHHGADLLLSASGVFEEPELDLYSTPNEVRKTSRSTIQFLLAKVAADPELQKKVMHRVQNFYWSSIS